MTLVVVLLLKVDSYRYIVNMCPGLAGFILGNAITIAHSLSLSLFLSLSLSLFLSLQISQFIHRGLNGRLY